MCLMVHLTGHQEHAPQHAPAQSAGTANDELRGILKRRYALGEITREQFEEMQRVLGLSVEEGTAPKPSQHVHHAES